ncbi:MAG: hypothetical protein AAF614_00855 [Chloroflexota bacterium]
MKLYSYLYNTIFHPAAPFVEISLSDYAEQQQPLTLIAQIDSGSDATAIPMQTLRHVNARFEETRVMRGISGIAQRVDMYLVAIRLAGVTFYPTVMAINGAEAIIGRDILNDLIVTLNGPASTTEISTT